MPGQKNRMLDAALAYARAGMPVTPAHPIVPAAPSRAWRRRWVCACRSGHCASPGAHPRGDSRRLMAPEAVTKVWAVDEPPGVLISPAEAVDSWRLPKELGALGMRLLESQRPAAWPPLMQAPDGSWVVCTLPLEGPAPTIEAYGLRVRRMGEDELVPVPPSRHIAGRLHWLWAQRFPKTPLPEPAPMLTALLAAAARLQPWELRDEVATAEGQRFAAS